MGLIYKAVVWISAEGIEFDLKIVVTWVILLVVVWAARREVLEVVVI
mgnify:CR=1 FL=1